MLETTRLATPGLDRATMPMLNGELLVTVWLIGNPFNREGLYIDSAFFTFTFTLHFFT